MPWVCDVRFSATKILSAEHGCHESADRIHGPGLERYPGDEKKASILADGPATPSIVVTAQIVFGGIHADTGKRIGWCSAVIEEEIQ